MALAGTLRDFSLADIFQLIALQKKTGYLTLKCETDVVTVTFFEGSVVGAESLNKRIEDRLGHVLVKTGRITKEELAKALEIQKQTLQRLGYILVAENFIDAESLRTALATQMQQTIYRLFRWKDGDYNFEARDQVEYDRENVRPMSAESILMEGIRMLDEWPLIEKKIPSFDKVFVKIPLPAPPVLETRGEVPSMEDLFGEGEKGGKAKAQDDVVRLSQEEMAVYQHVNGVFTVQEIIDRSGLNEFEACKALFELYNRQLIGSALPVEAEAPAEVRRFPLPSALLEGLVVPVFWGWVALSVLLFPFHPLSHLPWTDGPALREQRHLLTRLNLQRVASAVELYRFRTGHLPSSLEELSRVGYLPLKSLVGSDGQPLVYQTTENGYTLAARGPSGSIPEDLVVTGSE